MFDDYTITPEKKDEVRQLIPNNPYISVQKLAQNVDMLTTSVHHTLRPNRIDAW